MKNRLISVIIAILTALAFISGCNQHKSPNPVTSELLSSINPCCTPGTVAFEPFSFQPCIIDPAYAGVVVNSQAEYEQLLIDNNVYSVPGATPTPIAVDFTNKTLIGYIIGFSAPPFYTEITDMETDGRSLTVNVLHTTGGGICGVFYSTGCARAFAVIDKTNLPVHFNIQYNSVPCVSASPECTPADVTFTSFDGPSQTMGTGFYSNSRENIVIKSQADYDNFLAAHYVYAGMGPAPTPVPVDFSQKTMIAVFMGTSANLCRSTRIKEIKINCGTPSILPFIDLEILESYGACGVMCGEANCWPCHIVLIDKTDMPVFFNYVPVDQDNDGYSDSAEIAAGTDPCDPASHP
jgi:hypothetical protein